MASDNNTLRKDLGPVSAYAVAVAHGFDGTEAEWEQYIANASTKAAQASASATAAAQSEADAETARAAAVVAKVEAQTAAQSASAAYGTSLLAPNYSTEATYTVGQHVIYSGNLYSCITAITTPEAWDATHWTQVQVGNEVNDLKSAFVNGIVRSTTSIWVNGSLVSTTGITAVSTTKIRSEVIDRDIISVTPASGYYVCVFVYDGNTYLGNWNGSGYVKSLQRKTGEVRLLDIPSEYSIRLMGSKSDESNIVPDESVNFVGLYPTDNTLMLSGKAADAKKAGDAIQALETAQSTMEDDLDGMQEQVLDVTENVVTVDKLITDTKLTGVYISSASLIANANQSIYYLPVLAGKSYHVIYNNHSHYSDAYGAIAFSTDAPAAGVAVNVLVFCTIDPQNIDYTYMPTANGYLLIANAAKSGETAHSVAIKVKKWYDPENTLQIKLQTFGDSITDNVNNTWAGHITWVEFIEKALNNGCTVSLTNSAYGGSSLRNRNENSVINRVTSLLDTDSDIITVWAGTNDWSDGATIGDLSSADTTIMGAVKSIIEYLSEHTTAEIVWATPMQRYNNTDAGRETNANGEPLNSAGKTLKEYCDAIQSVCDFYGIDCIRMDKIAGFNRINIRQYASDGLHPSTVLANTRIASIFAAEMKRLWQM